MIFKELYIITCGTINISFDFISTIYTEVRFCFVSRECRIFISFPFFIVFVLPDVFFYWIRVYITTTETFCAMFCATKSWILFKSVINSNRNISNKLTIKCNTYLFYINWKNCWWRYWKRKTLNFFCRLWRDLCWC